MKFSSSDEVKARLGKLGSLTREELREIPPHVPWLGSTGDPNRLLNRYFAELFTLLADDLTSLDKAIDRSREALSDDLQTLRKAMEENIKAVRRFDVSSQKLTKWLIGLTVVLVVLTLVIAGFTILLWKRG